MKKKILTIIFIVSVAFTAYVFLFGRYMTMQEVFEKNSIDFNQCMAEADQIKVYVPSENIGVLEKKYVDTDRIVCVLDNREEIDEFVELCNEAKVLVYDQTQEEFDHDHPALYVFEVYRGEKLLCEFRMLDVALAIGKPYASKYYKINDDVEIYDYINTKYDKEPFTSYNDYPEYVEQLHKEN